MQTLVPDLIELLRSEYVDSLGWARLVVTSKHLLGYRAVPRLPNWIIYGVPKWEIQLGRFRDTFLHQMASIGWPQKAPSSVQVHAKKNRVLVKWWGDWPLQTECRTWSLRGCVMEFVHGQKSPGSWHKCDYGLGCSCSQIEIRYLRGASFMRLIEKRIGATVKIEPAPNRKDANRLNPGD